jgi:uncharacterized protein (DUF2141 family)
MVEVAMNASIRSTSLSLCGALAVGLLLVSTTGVATTGVAERNAFRLSGRVLGVSGKHAIYVALWRADGFLEKPAQHARLEAGAEPIFQFKVAGGRWALSAFEDQNGDGVLDMGVFGPKEPSAFWRPFNGWRKPRFDDVASLIDRDTAHADLSLK